MAKKDTAQIILRKRESVAAIIAGRTSASSSSLSASYGLPVDQVKAILRSKGVRDDD